MTLAETFDQLDWATIASYVELKQEEHLHLDFKTLRNAELTSGDDRRNIARSISGFANSSGGIIIWGIDARKNSDGIDCATAIVELQKPAVLVSRLNTLSGDATSPIIDGLRHKSIVS
jgi:predicted HTH transcriptional regulator